MSNKPERKPDSPFPGLSVPGPPEALREAILGKAREALAREPVPDAWTRIWESRPARLAWATCVAGLVVANLIVAPRPAGSGETSLVVRDQGRAAAEDEVARLARLPRLDVGMLLDERPAPETSTGRSAPAETGEEENS